MTWSPQSDVVIRRTRSGQEGWKVCSLRRLVPFEGVFPSEACSLYRPWSRQEPKNKRI